MRAEAEERGEQQRHARQRKARTRRVAMMPISAILTQRAIFALSTRSASVPDAPEKRKNGAMKMPPASMTSVAASMPPVCGQAIGDEDRQRALQQVVVERAEKLRDEQRREPARRQQRRHDRDS